MTKDFKILILIFLYVFITDGFAYAQKEVQIDTNSKIVIKQTTEINKYLNDEYYQYNNKSVKIEDSFITKILKRIIEYIVKLFSYKYSSTIFYIFVFGIILFVLIKLLGLNYESLFFKKSKNNKNINIETYKDDIYKLNLKKLLQQATETKNYNLAIRYLYLIYLKHLSDSEIVLWEINKTNIDYRNEIRNTKYYKNFNKLSLYYEYFWYGEFLINKEQFEYTSELFKKANNQ